MSMATRPPQPQPSYSVPPPVRYTSYTTPAAYPPAPSASPIQPYQFQNYAGYTIPNLPTPAPPPQPLPSRQFDTTPAADAPTVSKTLDQFLIGQLTAAGFSGAQRDALSRLEEELISYVSQLYKETKEFAGLASRSTPAVSDLVRVCISQELTPKDLRRTIRKASRKRKRAKPVALEKPPSREPSPTLLASDDEGTQPHLPPTMRYLVPNIPPLPPRHTYLRTPVAATVPKKALPSLEKKLANAALVQESLKHLIIATEDTNGPEDAELVGHVVNWENSVAARKRWRWK